MDNTTATPLSFGAFGREAGRSGSPLSEYAGPTSRADADRPAIPDTGGTTGGIYRREQAANVLVGPGPRKIDPRKFKYDVYAGMENPLGFSVTRDDRMSASEAGLMLHRIHGLMGVRNEMPEVLFAFDQAVFFCHTVNGASVLNPGRSKFTVPGKTEEFDYGHVRDILGTDFRRFFRAFADEVKAANKVVLDTYDPYDPESVERWGWLNEVATERGLSRYPYLAHDSADACLDLNMNERNALMLSKQKVIAAVPNSADRGRNIPHVMSADKYDSTNGESIAAN